MKIHEIIATDKEINEGLVSGAWQLIKGFRGEIIDDAVKQLTNVGKYAGKVTPAEVRKTINALGPKARQAAMKDASIYDDILKKANDARNPGLWQKTKNFIKGKPSAGPSAAGTALKAVTNYGGLLGKINLITDVYLAWGFSKSIVVAWREYFLNMAKAEKDLASGAITQADFDRIRQEEMSILVTKVAASIPGVVLTASGAISGPFAKLPILGPVLRLVGAFKRVGLVMYVRWLNSDEARDLMAKAAVFDSVNIPIIGPLLEKMGIQADISQVVGGTASGIVDKFKGKADQVQQGDAPANGQQSQSAKPALPTPDSNYEIPGPKPTAAPPQLDRSKWIDIGGGIIKNPQTGEQDFK